MVRYTLAGNTLEMVGEPFAMEGFLIKFMVHDDKLLLLTNDSKLTVRNDDWSVAHQVKFDSLGTAKSAITTFTTLEDTIILGDKAGSVHHATMSLEVTNPDKFKSHSN